MELVYIALWHWRHSTFGFDWQTFVTDATLGSCKKPTLSPGFFVFHSRNLCNLSPKAMFPRHPWAHNLGTIAI